MSVCLIENIQPGVLGHARCCQRLIVSLFHNMPPETQSRNFYVQCSRFPDILTRFSSDCSRCCVSIFHEQKDISTNFQRQPLTKTKTCHVTTFFVFFSFPSSNACAEQLSAVCCGFLFISFAVAVLYIDSIVLPIH